AARRRGLRARRLSPRPQRSDSRRHGHRRDVAPKGEDARSRSLRPGQARRIQAGTETKAVKSDLTPVQAPRRLFTVEEYHQMGEAGIFHEDDRVELLAGEIVEMTPIGSHHASCVSRLNR